MLLYLILNIIVSAATTLGVLVLWDRARKVETNPAPVVLATEVSGVQANPASKVTLAPSATSPVIAATPIPVDTLPAAETPVIEILSVVGTGDLESEVVVIKRVGEGNLSMAGWKLSGQSSTYTFPSQPELILYKGGAVQVFSKTGTDTVTDLYWNRTEAAWTSGETIRLLDPQGVERAVYQVP